MSVRENSVLAYVAPAFQAGIGSIPKCPPGRRALHKPGKSEPSGTLAGVLV